MHIYFCFGKFGSFRIPFAQVISCVGVGRSLQTSDQREESEPQPQHRVYFGGCAQGGSKGGEWALGDFPVLENGVFYHWGKSSRKKGILVF